MPIKHENILLRKETVTKDHGLSRPGCMKCLKHIRDRKLVCSCVGLYWKNKKKCVVTITEFSIHCKALIFINQAIVIIILLRGI